MLKHTIKPGDTIGVMAPASYVEKDDIEKSAACLEEYGYKVFVHPQTYEREHQSAGTALQKSLALQGLWQREDIKAIWAAGGGNRCLSLLESINFEKMKPIPKPFIGFSDTTALLNGIYAHTGIQSIHGPVFSAFHKHRQSKELINLLEGKDLVFPLDQATVINDGEAEGTLLGGNLSVFQYLPSLLGEDMLNDAILFLEDCGEELSRIDRMLLYLKQYGVFERVAALILGEFSDIQDTGRPFGFSLEEIIYEHTNGFNIPVIMNAPFGHGKTFFPLPVGCQAALSTSTPSVVLR